MRVLLLGSTGFIGRHVRDRLTERSADVATPGRGELDLACAGPAGIAAVLTAVAPDVVVNAAGATGSDVAALAALNVAAVADLVDAMVQAAPGARLVHLGSAAEYGPTGHGVSVAETAPARPASAYGLSKLAGTRIVTGARRPAVVLRITNPLGPGSPATSLPGSIARSIARASGPGEPVTLGPMQGWRDFVDVRDVADAVVAAALAAAPPPVVNVGTGRAVAVKEVLDELVAVSGHRGPVREEDGGSARSPGVRWQQSDVGLAHRALGWRPARALRTSVHDLWHESR